MSGEALQLAAWSAAFWLARAAYRGPSPVRFGAGLALGAVLAHLGGAIAVRGTAALPSGWLTDPVASVLFVPLGLLALEPGAAAWRALAPSLALARVGCLAAGCCAGPGGAPVALLEIAGLLGLGAALRCAPAAGAGPRFAAGFGGLRLALEPLRAVPSPTALALAATWLACGLACGLARGRVQR